MLNKQYLESIKIEVIENEMDYLPKLKEIYDDIFGKWAKNIWMQKVEQRDISKFSSKFINEVFGNYSALGYTIIITENYRVAFLNREHYHMIGDDECKGELAIIYLHEVKNFGYNGCDKFIMNTGDNIK